MKKEKELKIHNIDSAPEKSKELLENSKKASGFIPNLHGILAESPQVLQAYQTLHELFMNSSFNNDELTVVWQTFNVEHNCHYCVPAHTAIAKGMKVDDDITEALRNKKSMPNEKLQALHEMALAVAKNRGNVSREEIESFYSAGYEQRHLLEIILGLSQKVISNYTNHIAETRLDKPFEKFAWK